MSEWISVKERLPDNDEVVFVWTVGEQQCLAYLDGQYDGKPSWYIIPAHSGQFRSTCSVTHWMPLPGPPKKKEPFSICMCHNTLQFDLDGYFNYWLIPTMSDDERKYLAEWLNKMWTEHKS